MTEPSADRVSAVAQHWRVEQPGTVCAGFALSLASFALGQDPCACLGREHPVPKGSRKLEN